MGFLVKIGETPEKSQVPIIQIYTSTFDFEESISIIKTKG